MASFIAIGIYTFSVHNVTKYNEFEKKTIKIESGKFFEDSFHIFESLEETGSIEETSNINWWVNSGGIINMKDGLASTNIGKIEKDNKWRKLYNKNNPSDTDGGYYPQNLFRLILTSKWKNFSQQAYFKVSATNLSSSINRNESNGLLLFNRYADGNNLYYAGLRVDGFAVIKKKIKGTYYTLDLQQVLMGIYDKEKLPNLIPISEWIGVKTDVKDLANGKVEIKLYLDIGRTGKWILVASALDDGKKFGGSAINEVGYAGIRTDFMDVYFDDYRIESIK